MRNAAARSPTTSLTHTGLLLAACHAVVVVVVVELLHPMTIMAEPACPGCMAFFLLKGEQKFN